MSQELEPELKSQSQKARVSQELEPLLKSQRQKARMSQNQKIRVRESENYES